MAFVTREHALKDKSTACRASCWLRQQHTWRPQPEPFKGRAIPSVDRVDPVGQELSSGRARQRCLSERRTGWHAAAQQDGESDAGERGHWREEIGVAMHGDMPQ